MSLSSLTHPINFEQGTFYIPNRIVGDLEAAFQIAFVMRIVANSLIGGTFIYVFNVVSFELNIFTFMKSTAIFV